tara:strand:- start:1184 stop:1411 length:228 start_codon:yes stop_codon:yes gene_type:complete
MPYPMEKNLIIARSVAPHYPLPTLIIEVNVSGRANLCEHKNTEWVPAEPENNVGEDLFCLDCNESLPLEVDYENI